MLPRAVITCENLGAYIDLPANESTLVIYSPGADTEAAVALLKMFPAAQWMHFGDLDPEGVEISKRIAGELAIAVILLRAGIVEGQVVFIACDQATYRLA